MSRRVSFSDEVQHHGCSAPAGQFAHLADGIVLRLDRRRRAQFASERECLFRTVDDHDADRCQRVKKLQGDVAEPTETDECDGVPWFQPADRAFHRMIGGQSCIGMRCDGAWRHSFRQADKVAGLRQEIFGKAAVAREPRKVAVLAVHVLTAPARETGAVGDLGIDDHRIARSEPFDFGTDGDDGTGILVTRYVGKHDRNAIAELAFDNMEVGPAHTGTFDPDDHIIGFPDLRIGDLLEYQILRALQGRVVAVQTRRAHRYLTPFPRSVTAVRL